MVSLEQVRLSNEGIAALGPGLVAVVVGATNGVGETTVKQLAKYAVQPRVYLVGRSQEAADRIIASCQSINPEGKFTFIGGDSSLIRNIDAICEKITKAEQSINILCLTIGTLQIGMDTEEGLHYPMALTVYARHRYTTKLLPLVRRASKLRRVVSVFGAGWEGAVNQTDFQGSEMSWPRLQAHIASITTLSLEVLHQRAPEVSFIHNFPGAVESGIARGSIGPLMRTLKTIAGFLGSLVHIPLEQAGDRHLFLCTSARFSAGADDEAPGVQIADLDSARGTTGELCTGAFSIDAYGESSNAKVEKLLASLRSQSQEITGRIEGDIERILK